MELSDFHSEVERGCQYFVSARIPHRASHSGFVVEPSLEKIEVEYTKDDAIKRKYLVVPTYAFREEIFDIKEGERGNLIDLVFEANKSKILAYIVQWKGAFNLYYNNPAAIPIASEICGINPSNKERIILTGNKLMKLEELFFVSKREPPKKK